MREIKFRAWYDDGERKEMIVFGLFDTDEGYFIKHQVSIDCCPIMQYTGLKDKNGKEIYEGDIMDYGGGRVFYITYDQCQFVATFSEHHTNIMIPIYAFNIIGNIYENPELIK